MAAVRFQPAVQRRIWGRDATLLIATPCAVSTGVRRWWLGSGNDALA